MPTLHIEHPITDFATWKGAFDRIADVRAKSGVLRHRVQRPVDDPRYVVIDLEFAQTAEAETFLAFLQSKVWSSSTNSPRHSADQDPRTGLNRVADPRNEIAR